MGPLPGILVYLTNFKHEHFLTMRLCNWMAKLICSGNRQKLVVPPNYSVFCSIIHVVMLNYNRSQPIGTLQKREALKQLSFVFFSRGQWQVQCTVPYSMIYVLTYHPMLVKMRIFTTKYFGIFVSVFFSNNNS